MNRHRAVLCSSLLGDTELEPRSCPDEAGSGGSGRRGTVAVLYARTDSVYKTIEGCDVWDIERDARNFAGGMPIVAHPPCRAWGGLSHMAKPRPDEKDLARKAVAMIREHGGVLEHPWRSKLWPDQGLPEPGARDAWGGFTVAVPQFWFGHRANKATRLYVCGCEPKDLPEIPMTLGDAPCVVTTCKKKHATPDAEWKERLGPRENEATPLRFAMWLCEVARRCVPSGRRGCGAAGDGNATQQTGACSPSDLSSETGSAEKPLTGRGA